MKQTTLTKYISSSIAVAAVMMMVLFQACSTTRRLEAGDILYTGVKKIEYIKPDSVKLPEAVTDDVFNAVNVKPNNSLYSPYIRWPFPIGLWVYNNWNDPGKGVGHWLYNKLVAEPVTIADVRPEIRVHMIDQTLDNNGYFSSHASYELVKGHNSKKARIRYKINPGPAYPLHTVELLPDTCQLNHLIDSIARKSTYLKPGNRYSVDSLATERVNIANSLRNRGYYFFRPEFIEYLADSIMCPGAIALRMTLASNTMPMALKPYTTGKVTTTIFRSEGGGTPDTIATSRGTVIRMNPLRLNDDLIPSCITFREGRLFSVRDMNRTQTFLSRLGIFNAIDINAVPDSEDPNRLNININCTFDKPLEASAELNVTSKSNSYLGPGLTLRLTNKNLFGGGEQLSVDLRGAYEWQTGKGRSSIFNSYEAGLNTTLAFPRLIAPKFIPRTRRELNWTRITLGTDLLNRPHYFNMAEFNTGITYDWRATRHVTTSFTPFKLTYTKLIRTTAEFDSIMNANQAIAQSFQSQFIPQLSYSYIYDRELDSKNKINWQFSVMEAGNLFWGIYEMLGNNGSKTLFGTPFSQFIKGQTQLVYNYHIGSNHHIVSRVATGVAHAYGNSSQVPYSEQFYCGGANSVRAFTVRSIGPGSYRVPENQINGYFDQTGTFKFEFNVEYRFPLLGSLNGAVFFDSGNVWLLKNDPDRPGGKLKASSFLKDLATGTGFGLRFDIGMLVVRGDLGIAIHAPYTTTRSGYYNIPTFKDGLAFHLAIGYPF